VVHARQAERTGDYASRRMVALNCRRPHDSGGNCHIALLLAQNRKNGLCCPHLVAPK
jgi:hypothetical protein